MAITIQLRGDTAADWTENDPVLAEREMALETDTGKFKIGDGTTAWTGLPYAGLPGPTGAPGQSVGGIDGGTPVSIYGGNSTLDGGTP